MWAMSGRSQTPNARAEVGGEGLGIGCHDDDVDDDFVGALAAGPDESLLGVSRHVDRDDGGLRGRGEVRLAGLIADRHGDARGGGERRQVRHQLGLHGGDECLGGGGHQSLNFPSTRS